MGLKAKPYLQGVSFRQDTKPDNQVYPFNIPAVRDLHRLQFHPDVTFLVGENGSGKSTLLEAIAVALGFGPEGGTKNVRFSTAETVSSLHNHIRLVKSFQAPKDHYFLRAESFYNVATYMDATGYLKGYGGSSLHHRSHGESFLALLTTKLRGPRARIMFLDDTGVSEVSYEETEHYIVTRDFLNNHRRRLEVLLSDEDAV